MGGRHLDPRFGRDEEPSSAIFHWEGVKLSRTDVSEGVVDGLWGTGPDDVWGFGDHAGCQGCRDEGLLMRWDGRSWSRVQGPGFAAMVGRAKDDLWAVVAVSPDSEQGGEPGLYHWDGAAGTRTGGLGAMNPTAMWAAEDGRTGVRRCGQRGDPPEP